jgi:hypothetical protein
MTNGVKLRVFGMINARKGYLTSPGFRMCLMSCGLKDFGRFQSVARSGQENAYASGPFRAKRLYRLTQGKPWAMFSCPFGARD